MSKDTSTRHWECSDLRDMHYDILRLRRYEIGGARWADLMRGIADMMMAADVELQAEAAASKDPTR